MKNLPVHERDTPNLKYLNRCSTSASLRRAVLEDEYRDPVDRAWCKGDFGDYAFQIIVPHSHISYVVHGDIYQDMLSNPKIWRLTRVKSLAGTMFNLDYPSAVQNRLQHSIVAAIMAERTLMHHNASEHDINLAILAFLAHDSATVPLSDCGRLACPRELDEEENVSDYLDESFDEIFKKYGVTKKEVVEAVKGRGSVGKLVNSRGVDLDKVAYTGVDVQYTMHGPDDVGSILRQDSYIFDIYEDIRFKDGEVVFSDPERLWLFLMTRAHMFSKVYLCDENRVKGAHLGKILQNMWKNGQLTKENMLNMGDEKLWELLVETDEISFTTAAMVWSRYEEIGRYRNRAEAAEAHRGGDVFIDPFPQFNTATQTLTVHDGKSVSFMESLPDLVEEVEKIAEESRYVGVYKLNGRD